MPVPKLVTWPRDPERQPYDTASWNRWINFANGHLAAPQVWAQDSGSPGLTWDPATPRMTLGAPLVVTGTAAFSGAVTMTSTVAISGPLTVSNTAQFSGAVTVTAAGSLTAAGPVSITGPTMSVSAGTATTLAGTVGISGALTASGAVAVTGPSFAVTPLATFAAGITLTGGNLQLAGTGRRITGDFSNPTEGNRPMFQSSVLNGYTAVGVIPNGTGGSAVLAVYSAPNPDASARLYLGSSSATQYLGSDALGGATPLPLSISVNGVVRQTFATNGDIVFGSGTTVKLGFFGSAGTAKPTVGDPRGGNLALASLLTALVGLGLINNVTTP